jgi:hypothetical protein
MFNRLDGTIAKIYSNNFKSLTCQAGASRGVLPAVAPAWPCCVDLLASFSQEADRSGRFFSDLAAGAARPCRSVGGVPADQVAIVL